MREPCLAYLQRARAQLSAESGRIDGLIVAPPTYFPIRLTPPPPSLTCLHSSRQQCDAQMGNNSRGVTFINSVLISRAVINIVALVISSVLITRLLFCSATGPSSRVGSSNFQPQAKLCSDLVCFEVRVLQFSGKLNEFCRSMTV